MPFKRIGKIKNNVAPLIGRTRIEPDAYARLRAVKEVPDGKQLFQIHFILAREFLAVPRYDANPFVTRNTTERAAILYWPEILFMNGENISVYSIRWVFLRDLSVVHSREDAVMRMAKLCGIKLTEPWMFDMFIIGKKKLEVRTERDYYVPIWVLPLWLLTCTHYDFIQEIGVQELLGDFERHLIFLERMAETQPLRFHYRATREFLRTTTQHLFESMFLIMRSAYDYDLKNGGNGLQEILSLEEETPYKLDPKAQIARIAARQEPKSTRKNLDPPDPSQTPLSNRTSAFSSMMNSPTTPVKRRQLPPPSEHEDHVNRAKRPNYLMPSMYKLDGSRLEGALEPTKKEGGAPAEKPKESDVAAPPAEIVNLVQQVREPTPPPEPEHANYEFMLDGPDPTYLVGDAMFNGEDYRSEEDDLDEIQEERTDILAEKAKRQG